VDSVVETTVHLPAVTVEDVPVQVECTLPAYARVHLPLTLTYNLRNRTGYIEEFEATMENCDNFVFTGPKQVS